LSSLTRGYGRPDTGHGPASARPIPRRHPGGGAGGHRRHLRPARASHGWGL